MAYEHAAQADISRRGHVPHSDGAVFGAGHHQTVTEAQVQHGLVVVDKSVQHLARVHVPYPVYKRDRERQNEHCSRISHYTTAGNGGEVKRTDREEGV